jgi:hypothetical protein
MTLILERFVPPFALVLERFGPDASIAALAQLPLPSVAAVIGPAGDSGSISRVEQVPALATWTINHNLGREVQPQVFGPGGIMLSAEVLRTSINQFKVLFDEPTSGFVLYR